MNMTELDAKTKLVLPFKNVAAALLFCVFLGPVGLLYSSVIGGAALIAIAFIAVIDKFYVVLGLVWLISCVWGVAATNKYNKKIIQA